MKLTYKYHLFNRSDAEVSEDLRQRVIATSKKITRYEKRVQQYQQNRLFTTDQKKVFQQISGEEVRFNQPSPPKEEATAFWRNLWDPPVAQHCSRVVTSSGVLNQKGTSSREHSHYIRESIKTSGQDEELQGSRT